MTYVVRKHKNVYHTSLQPLIFLRLFIAIGRVAEQREVPSFQLRVSLHRKLLLLSICAITIFHLLAGPVLNQRILGSEAMLPRFSQLFQIREMNFSKPGERNFYNQEINEPTLQETWKECHRISKFAEKRKEIAEFNRFVSK